VAAARAGSRGPPRRPGAQTQASGGRSGDCESGGAAALGRARSRAAVELQRLPQPPPLSPPPTSSASRDHALGPHS
jgi:hypothetical protein